LKGNIMAKTTITVNGKKINVNTDKANVAEALQNLINALTERRFGIGMFLRHSNGSRYQLVRIAKGGMIRAYLINQDTGKARNSRKVVWVKTDDSDYPNGYVTDLPCEKDRFYDPENPGHYIDL